MEIIEEIVTVSPPLSKDHHTTAALLQRRLYTVIPEDWGIYQTFGLSLPERGGIYIPDLVVVPRAVASGTGNTVPAEEALPHGESPCGRAAVVCGVNYPRAPVTCPGTRCRSSPTRCCPSCR